MLLLRGVNGIHSQILSHREIIASLDRTGLPLPSILFEVQHFAAKPLCLAEIEKRTNLDKLSGNTTHKINVIIYKYKNVCIIVPS